MPYHSIYFHDDDAVQRLIEAYNWDTEFPNLSHHLKCILYTGAMKIDVWIVMIPYKYGGIYTDIDNWPSPDKWSESEPILPNDEAFFLSDSWTRPSQWFQCMVPNHPIAFHTLQEISNRLLDMKNIAQPAVVMVTGPNALKHGYGTALGWGKEPMIQNIFDGGTFVGVHNCTVRVLPRFMTDSYVLGNLGGTYNDPVPWNTSHMITKRERVELQSGVMHWNKEVFKVKETRQEIFSGSCRAYLDKLQQEQDS